MDQLWLPTSTLLHRWLTMLKDDATVNKKALEDLLNRDLRWRFFTFTDSISNQ